MMAKTVFVEYKGKIHEVLVACEPRTTPQELNERALKTVIKQVEKKANEKAKREAEFLERCLAHSY